MTAKETAGREGKGEDGRARTREVKLAVFFTQDELDEDGYPVRDPGLLQLHRHLRARRRVRRHGEGRRHPPRRRSRPPAHHPRRRRRLDLEHRRATSSPRPPRSWTCSTPASTCTASPAAWSSCSATSKDEWLAARLEDLDYGDIDGICAAARDYPLEGVKKDEVDKELGYFVNNAPRMRYKLVPLPRPVRRLRRRRVRLQGGHRPAPQTLRHALDRRRRRRHHHPPLPAGQPPRRPDLAPHVTTRHPRLTSHAS